MAYQIIENVNRPGIIPRDQLLYFTQSVIDREREISQTPMERKPKTSQVFNPKTLPRGFSYTPEVVDKSMYSKTMEPTRNVPRGNSAGSVRIEQDSRQKKLVSISREPAFGSEIFQHSLGPRSQMTECRESIIWTPTQTPQTFKDFKTSDCNVTLSRVYFTQGSEINGDQVSTNGYDHARSDPEKFGSPNQLNINIADRQKNGFKNKITVPSGRQNAPSSSNSPVAKPNLLLGGMFQNPQPARGCRKRTESRSSSEEYIYFLPEFEYQESMAASLSHEPVSSKSFSVSNLCFPPVKRSRTELEEEPEIIVIPDENEVVSTKECGDKEPDLLQVVTDCDGRIHVKVANIAEKQNALRTKTVIAHGNSRPKTNHGGLERTLRGYHDCKNHLDSHECSSDGFKNPSPETWNHNSALITNDHRWDAWKRANCIASDGFHPGFNLYTNHPHYRTVQACEEDLDITSSQEENDNKNSSKFETSDLNKFMQNPSLFAPGNRKSSQTKAAKQNVNVIKCCVQGTQKEIYTERLYNTPKVNCSGNCQSLSKNDQRCACMDRQNGYYQKMRPSAYDNIKTKGLQVVGVSSRRHSCGHNFRNSQTEDAGSICSKKCENCLRQEAFVVHDNCKDQPSTILPCDQDDVQTHGSAPKSKESSSKSSLNGTLSQSTTEKKNGSNCIEKDIQSKKDANNPSKETLTKSSNAKIDGRYQCDWPACGKAFRHYSFLVLHKRVHTGERPYVCSWEGCSKQFRRSDDYQRHYRVHTGVKPYVCVFCGKGFKRSDHRLFHYRAIHHIKGSDKIKRGKRTNVIRQDIAGN